MAGPHRILLPLAALIALGGCRPGPPDNAALAASIERQVLARQPRLRLERYARFYAHGPHRTVTGVYVFANAGDQPLAGRSGEIVWTTPEALPVIYDGGCSVLGIVYDEAAGRLRSLSCDGPGVE